LRCGLSLPRREVHACAGRLAPVIAVAATQIPIGEILAKFKDLAL
jgi:hypothetical protein